MVSFNDKSFDEIASFHGEFDLLPRVSSQQRQKILTQRGNKMNRYFKLSLGKKRMKASAFISSALIFFLITLGFGGGGGDGTQRVF